MKIKQACQSYDNDLLWISQRGDVPTVIKDYAIELKKKEKPTRSVLKANVARAACKKRKLNPKVEMKHSQNVIVNIGSVVNSTLSNAGQEKSSSAKVAEKRKDDKEPPSIWKDWKEYIDQNIDSFHPYSLVVNEVVRAGDGVSGKPGLKEALYKRHMSLKTNTRYLIPEDFKAHIRAFAMAKSKPESKRAIQGLSLLLNQKEDSNMEFLHDVLLEIRRAYTSHIDIQQS